MLLIACVFLAAALVAGYFAIGVLGDRESAAAVRLRTIREQSIQSQTDINLDSSEDYGFAGRVTPRAFIERAERNLMLAGRPEGWSVAKTLSLKVILGSIGLALGLNYFLGNGGLMGLVMLIGGPALGYFGPDVLLANRARSRQAEIQYGLPDLLDQITISIESGSTFEAALKRVATSTSGPLTEEIVRTLQDMALGVPRRDAYAAMADRTDVDEMRKFTRAIIQGEEFGVPIAEIVRDQAAEMRVSRRLRAEAVANKIPVKVLLPLICAIMPVLFIVIVGPAVLSAMEYFGS